MSDGTVALSDWLENQKERAKAAINDDSVDETETEQWRGERQFIDALQTYLATGIVVVDDTNRKHTTGQIAGYGFSLRVDGEAPDELVAVIEAALASVKAEQEQ